MEMVSILEKKNRRIVRRSSFFATKILMPLVLIISFAVIAKEKIPQEKFFTFVSVIPGVGDKWQTFVASIPGIYLPILWVIFFIIYRFIMEKILGQTQVFLHNHYYIVPSWMIKWASLINGQYIGSATSIPVWQFCEYLYYKSTLGWRRLELDIPDVLTAEAGVQIRNEFGVLDSVVADPTVLSLIISDTYSVDLDYLPELVKTHKYVVFQTLKDGKEDRVRRFNANLVSDIVSRIKQAESEEVKTIYLLFNTNTKIISEVFREAFSDAGRNPIEHLFVYENQSNPPYHFTNAHQIF